MIDYLITEHKELCPYCNAAISLLVDRSLDQQSYIEDCEVCCQPVMVKIDDAHTSAPSIQLMQENDVV